eukprot:CAMPEP_0196601192 /NCGR_PEP_ID=MMETSP1081-20130531/95780_1 /TAXON_ID=36882 /ORGANISM="Pyramimonas amylifera, Strain CCMP720" /LENGTH=193 /DNA_ID=CAMNT_0041927061 /DNA_START=1256 /DNA_END=1837 /DNA_ORIENTATION=+
MKQFCFARIYFHITTASQVVEVPLSVNGLEVRREDEEERGQGPQAVNPLLAALLDVHPVKQLVSDIMRTPPSCVEQHNAWVEVASVSFPVEGLGETAVLPERLCEVALELELAELGGGDHKLLQLRAPKQLNPVHHYHVRIEIDTSLDALWQHVWQIDPGIVQWALQVPSSISHSANGSGEIVGIYEISAERQ